MLLSYPISSSLISLPSWAFYLIFIGAFATAFFTLRGRGISMGIFGALSSFALAFAISNYYFHMDTPVYPPFSIIAQLPNTSSVWIVAACAGLIGGILSFFWKGLGIFLSNMFFGFSIGFLVTNLFMASLLLGFFFGFLQILSPCLTILLASSITGSLWAGEAIGLILHNGRFYNVLLWSLGFFVSSTLLQWALNRDLFRKKALVSENEEESLIPPADSLVYIPELKQPFENIPSQEDSTNNTSPSLSSLPKDSHPSFTELDYSKEKTLDSTVEPLSVDPVSSAKPKSQAPTIPETKHNICPPTTNIPQRSSVIDTSLELDSFSTSQSLPKDKTL